MAVLTFPEQVGTAAQYYAGVSDFTPVGERRALPTANPATIWTGPTDDYPWDTVTGELTAASDDADDDIAGAGARRVLVFGLDENFVLQTRTMDLEGTTPVTIPGTWSRVFIARVTEVGTLGGSNIGTISLTLDSQVVAQIRGPIAAGGIKAAGRSYLAGLTVPADTHYAMVHATTAAEANKPLTIELRFRLRQSLEDPTLRPWATSASIFGMEGFEPVLLRPAIVFPPLTDIEFTAVADNPNTSVTQIVSGHFVKKDDIDFLGVPGARIS